jgi:hypothetical protein
MGAAVLPDAAVLGILKRYPIVPRLPFIRGISSTVPRRNRCVLITGLMWYFAEQFLLFFLPSYFMYKY